jgi:hypothetical protein
MPMRVHAASTTVCASGEPLKKTAFASTADSREVAEAKRIAKRADIASQRLRAATTEAQWIEHQRGSLRRVAVELRQFERRYHLMLIEPRWPTRPAAPHVNEKNCIA